MNAHIAIAMWAFLLRVFLVTIHLVPELLEPCGVQAFDCFINCVKYIFQHLNVLLL